MHHDSSSTLTAPSSTTTTSTTTTTSATATATATTTLTGDRLSPWHAPLRRLLARVRHGQLSLTLPDGRRIEVVGAAPGPRAELRLHRWRPAWRLLLQGDLGLALSYRDGDWSSADLTELLRFGLANEAALGVIESRGPARWLARWRHRANANTRRGSRHNIAAHYDLGNEFYARWLDESMLYSSAMYEAEEPRPTAGAEYEAHLAPSPAKRERAGGEGSPNGTVCVERALTPTSLPLRGRGADAASPQTLESAQAQRLDRIVELLDPRAGERVLEIGCGWGTLAATLARRCGVEVVGVTLSTEQLAFARERAAQYGVAPEVDLRLQDYRDISGQFDRIVSIEMIEAVGEAYWPTYFATLKDRLKPGGVAVLQAITIDESQFERYRDSPDFIQHCIFPGGMLPTPERMAAEARRAGLRLTTESRFGRGYALTLREWRRRFLAEWPAIQALGFDEAFRRLWTYYLCYCEAGFLAGRVDVGLYRLTHADGER